MNIIIPLVSLVVLVFINLTISYKGNKLYWMYESSHFLAGFLLAALLSSFLDNKLVLLAVLTISLSWEIYELIVSRSKYLREFFEAKFKIYITPPTFLDTGLDLLLDVLGAVFYLYLF